MAFPSEMGYGQHQLEGREQRHLIQAGKPQTQVVLNDDGSQSELH